MILNHFIFIAFVFISAKMDANLLNRGSFIYEHWTRLCIRLIVIYLLSTNWINFLAYSLFFAGTFDNTLNVLRSKELFHLGNTARWDKFWNRRVNLYKVFTIISITTSIYLLIKN